MRTKKAIITAALVAPMLALGGGIAYATTSPSPPAPARTTVTTTAHPASQHTTSPAGRNSRYGDCCNWRGHGYQRGTHRQATPQRNHHNAASQQRSHQANGNHGNRGYGNQGNWGYQGSGQHGNGNQWGNGCCRGNSH